jgi:hypothetical protein
LSWRIAASTAVESLRCRPQAVAELAEDRVVEAGVVQLQAQRVLPVDAGAHRVGRLAVRQALRELHQRHQGELRRGERGLAEEREERGELPIGVEAAQLVVHPQVGVALGERGPRDARRVLRHHVDGLRLQRHGLPPLMP